MEQTLLKEYFPLILTPQQLNEAMDTTSGAPMIIKKVLLQKKDTENRNKRIYPGPVLEREINKYNDTMVKTRRALGELDHCFTDDNFDVLTADGWKKFQDVSVGEKVLSYNIESREYEYKPVLRKVDLEHEGDSYTIKGRNIDTQVTSKHNFILEDRYSNQSFVSIEDIYNNRTKYNKSKIIKTGKLVTDESKTITLKGIVPEKHGINLYPNDIEVDTKVFAGILGFWLAEGYCTKGKDSVNGQVVLCQNKGEKLDEFIELLEQSPFEYRVDTANKKEKQMLVRIKNHQLHKQFKNLGNKYTKFIPKEFKNFDSESLESLLYFHNLGDGRNQFGKHGHRMNVFSVSKQLIDDLQECLIKVGGSGSLTIAHKKGKISYFGRTITATKDLHQLNFSTVSGIYLDNRFVKIEKVQHIGRKYCLEVADNHSFYVRQNNKCFITGNCNQMIVNLKNASHIITEMWWEGDSVFGNIEILDTEEFPAGRIAAGLLRRKIPVGISSRALGSVNETNEGISIVNDDLALACFDLVSYESTIGSTLNSLNEGVNSYNRKFDKFDSIIYEILCNNSGKK